MQSHQMKRAAGNSAPTDPNFKQTVLLLHGDGTNGGQNNTFIDSSTNNFTITRNGNTTQGTFSPFSQSDGYWSNYFDGVGDQLSFTDSSNNFDLGGAVKSLEFWFFPNAQGTQVLFGKHGGVSSWSTANGFEYSVQYTGGILYFYYNNAGTPVAVTDSVTRSAFQWFYIAVATDASNNISFYVNGSRVATATNAITKPTTRTSMLIGNDLGGNGTVGYISNLRFINGTGAINPSSSTIAVPSVPLTAVTNTILLTCLSNRFVDKSSSPFTLTSGANVSVTAFSPFAPTAAYSASINGGSGYFDGTGDYLSIADNAALDMGSSNFTIEGWYYPFGNAVISTGIFSKRANSSTFGGVLLYYGSAGLTPSLLVDTGGTWGINAASSIAFNANAWNHFAVVRNGTAFNLYINGVSGVSATSSATIPDNSSVFTIGSAGTADFPINTCYMSDFRVVKGTAVYTSAFTPPTTPLTAITNTQLLCNFTNAAIFDNTGKNDLETVGNAQISTSVVKYGTGSMYFDGTGDSLNIVSSSDLIFGSGNFTVEFWMYTSDAAADVISKRASGGYGAFGIYISGANTIQGYVSTTGTSWVFTGTRTFTNNVWAHIALVRDGSSIYLYLDGSQSTSGSVSTSSLMSETNPVIIGGTRGNGDFVGYIDDLRITKGVARYTANFTVPARAFPDK